MMEISSHPTAAMATITIRNVPEVVHQLLRERAEKNGHSLNAELIQVLILEVSRKPKDIDKMLEDLRAFKATLPDMEPVSMEQLKEWIEDGRA